MKTGDIFTIRVPAGKSDPITQTRHGRKAFEVEIVEVFPDGLRIKCEGCWPPGGFRVSHEHWATRWAPFATPAGRVPT